MKALLRLANLKHRIDQNARRLMHSTFNMKRLNWIVNKHLRLLLHYVGGVWCGAFNQWW